MIIDYKQPILPEGSFTWAEYALLPQFKRYAVPTEKEYIEAVRLFDFLQPLREKLGLPLVITSGVRTKEYTINLRKRGIPAALNSAHNHWQAVDLVCPKLSVKELYQFFDKHWLGRMELLAYTPTWVHLDTRSWGKKIRFKP